ncbi:MAG: flagellar biosynthetic protein FliR [Sandaracinaceae bacterium]
MESLSATLFGSDVDLARLAAVFVLVAARVVPLAWLAPWLGWRGTAASVRVAVAVVLSMALTPLALSVCPPLPAGVLTLSVMSLRELLVGATFAVAVSVPLYALSWTGALVDRWRGSVSPAGPGPLATLHLAAGVVLFVSLGGHRLALAAFAATFSDLPPGSPADSTVALGVARVLADALVLSVALAAPTALAMVLVDVAMGLWGRIAPGLRAFLVALPLRAALGLAVALVSLSVALPRLAPVFASSIDAASDLVRPTSP